jgi:hypothetical protein
MRVFNGATENISRYVVVIMYIMEQEGHQNVWWGTVPLRKGSMGNRREEI